MTPQTPTLFDMSPLEPSRTPTRKQTARKLARPKQTAQEGKALGEKAFEKASDEWKAAIYDFAVREFLPNRREAFIFEVLTLAYDRESLRRALPLTTSPQAWNGLTNRLLREKLIEPAGGCGQRTNGNYSLLYRSLV